MKKINKKKARRNRAILVCIIVVLSLGIFNHTRLQLWHAGYTFDQQTIILQSDDVSHYLDKKIDIDAWNTKKNDQHYYDYATVHQQTGLSKTKTISYVDDVYQVYPSLQKLGYSIDTVRSLMKQNMSIKEFKALAKSKVSYTTAKKYFKINGFVAEDLKKYVASKKKPLAAVLSISHAQINSKNDVTRTYTIENPSYTSLVKKGYGISKNYVPDDLVTVNIATASSTTPNKLRKAAATALEKMAKAAKKKGLELVINSAYRSYTQQEELFNEYHAMYDTETADSLVAQPGYSEHQLGLGVDMTSQSVVDGEYSTFGETDEYQWMKKNAYKYGFILRYPSSKTSMTGTSNEPWHYRYVGKKVAKECYEKNWTLEEYILHHGFDTEINAE
jgi:D-alanyl-D-alanine carboxypeptidase